jgi:single-stranded-DNA-specific exonuclease
MQTLSFSPLFTELLAVRGLTDPEEIEAFLTAGLNQLEDPLEMKGMTLAVSRIEQAVSRREKILVHGDYDVDGVTGTALMARTLSILGADFDTFLPERERDGYGVSEEAIRRAYGNGFSLLITVDCGVTAHHQMELARSFGMDTLVIDHHRIPREGLPPASMILNPQQEDCPYPFKELSAAGLVFKLSQALIGPRAFQFLDLVALSTVSDVAPLRGENRILVKCGLERLAERSNTGLRALAEIAGIQSRQWNVGHLGFILGPRINASGRMSSPDISLRLLMTGNAKEAESLAHVLHEENKLRQKEERQIVKEAIWEVERTVNFNRDRVLVVGRAGWHPGVIGIVAARLVEKYHRPAVVIAVREGKGKGSGRSIKNFHLFRALEACKDLFEEFGGHEQAVGLTLKEENLALFRQRINRHALENYPPETFMKKLPVDLELNLGDLSAVFIQELKLLEPHGAGNPCPVFLSSRLEVKTNPKRLHSQTLQFWVTDGLVTCEALIRDRTGIDYSYLEKQTEVDLIYSVKTRLWDGRESLVLEVKEIKQRL